MSAPSPPPRASIGYVGHATVLVDIDGVRLLTDPLLRNRVTHLRRAAKVDPAALRGVHRPAEGGGELVRVADTDAVAAQHPRQRRVVDVEELRLEAPPVVELLGVLLVREGAVVEDDDDHADAVARGRLELLEHVAEGAVAGEAQDALVGRGQLGADGRGQAPSRSRRSPGRRQPAPGPAQRQQVDRPQRAVAGVRADDGLVVDEARHLGEDALRPDPAAPRGEQRCDPGAPFGEASSRRVRPSRQRPLDPLVPRQRVEFGLAGAVIPDQPVPLGAGRLRLVDTRTGRPGRRRHRTCRGSLASGPRLPTPTPGRRRPRPGCGAAR